MHVYNSQISTSIICFKYLKIVTVNPVRTNKESISFFNYALTRKLPLKYAHINKQRWDRCLKCGKLANPATFLLLRLS